MHGASARRWLETYPRRSASKSIMTTEAYLGEIEKILNPILLDMADNYDSTSTRCDWAYYFLTGATILCTATIPALSPIRNEVPWLTPLLAVIASVSAGLQARFRFDERGRQWTRMLIEYEVLVGDWKQLRLEVLGVPLEEVRAKIDSETRRLRDRVAVLERMDTASFYEDLARQAHTSE